MYASMCVLPGMDPRKIRDKECQDNCIYISRLDVFFAALFDGHGENGGHIAKSWVETVKHYFHDTEAIEEP